MKTWDHRLRDYHLPELDLLATQIGEWATGKGFIVTWHNVPEKLMLVVTELSEAMEAYRHLSPFILDRLQEGDKDAREQQKHLDNFKEELADTLIRLLDLCGRLNISIADEVGKKMKTNEGRPHLHGKQR